MKTSRRILRILLLVVLLCSVLTVSVLAADGEGRCYAALYVNGAYWGVYCIREDYSERYVADHLGVPEEDIYISHAPVIPMQATQELHDNMFRASRMAGHRLIS